MDAMGGDLGPRSVVPACARFIARFPKAELKLFGPRSQLQSLLLDQPPALRERMEIVCCEQVITQECNPVQALRRKRESSMARALQAVADGECGAVVTSGNTGALLALGRSILGTVPGVRRPALGKSIPTADSSCFLLDLGANIDCTAEDLVQFARLGVEAQRVFSGRESLEVALLNIGAEEHKGTEEIRRAGQLLGADPTINYVGFVEGHDIFAGVVDVVVCNGLMGNVAMKSAEGVIRLIGQKTFTIDKKAPIKRFFGQLAINLLRKWRTQLEPGRYNGASFLGLQGNVIKSHGGASSEAFYRAMLTARECAEADLAGRLDSAMSAVAQRQMGDG
ncbi:MULTISPECIES: phosphate acyltransferase PlsX [Microbulbifer]|uniref:Phosphate acyltransferase n=1 Tax=Microbulbifer celer TaxID=435905 RepID=A0ABW3U9P0_9GAMM|nr:MULTISPECIES: phosphate acyltransferase PlsX [Microbulbifer]